MNAVEKLKSIPHLKLPINFDVDPLVEEVTPILPNLIGYELPGEDRTEEERNRYRENWRGRGLIDFEPDSSKGMFDARPYKNQPSPFEIERTAWGKPIYHHTELAEVLPFCMLVIDQLFYEPGRCRITSMRSGGSLNWHSHSQFYTDNYKNHVEYDIAIVHIPLITNPNVDFGVTKFHHSEHGTNPIWQHYGVGECWLLNAWHEHTVKNEGDEDRVHLMMYGSLKDIRLRSLIDDAVEQYDGPYIE
jgi:hypothetical protein